MRRFFRFHKDAFSSVSEMQELVASSIKEHYGLDTVEFEYLKPTSVCVGLRLNTGRYFFKETEGDCSAESLLGFIVRLRDAGVPMPQIEPSLTGSLQIPFCSRQAYLIKAVKGCPMDGNDLSQTRVSAQALAAFHAHGMTPSMDRVPRNTSFGPNSVSAQHEEWFPRTQAIILENIDAFSASHASTVRAALAMLETPAEALSAPLPEANIHGDYKPSHVFHVGGVVTGLIDFDAAGHAHRLLDLLSATGAGLNHEGGQNPSFTAQAEFIRTYSELSPLTVEERTALPFLLLWANISRLGGLCSWRSRDVPVEGSMYDSTLGDIDRLLSAGPTLCKTIGLN